MQNHYDKFVAAAEYVRNRVWLSLLLMVLLFGGAALVLQEGLLLRVLGVAVGLPALALFVQCCINGQRKSADSEQEDWW